MIKYEYSRHNAQGPAARACKSAAQAWALAFADLATGQALPVRITDGKIKYGSLKIIEIWKAAGN